LVRKHSIDPSSRALDGTIPPIQKYGGSPEVENAAFKLKTGEVSGVIQVGYNHYIILKCEGRTEPHVTDIAQVRDILIQELKEEKIHLAVAKTFEKLKNEARVTNYVTGETSGSDGRATGKNSAGSPAAINQASGTGPRKTASQIADEPDSAAPSRAPAPGKSGARPSGKASRGAPIEQ